MPSLSQIVKEEVEQQKRAAPDELG